MSRARKKKAPTFKGITLSSPFAFNLSQAQGFMSNTITLSPSISVGFIDVTPPEPKGEPKTEIGLIGYRLYSLDNELYLRGLQGNRQEGQESEKAKHTGDDNFVSMGPSFGANKGVHPAPGWDCLCGFAAFFWPTSLDEPGWAGVLAEVQAGGRTICCDTGWRAERIVLNKLWVACPVLPNSALEILRKRYEVPVEVL